MEQKTEQLMTVIGTFIDGELVMIEDIDGSIHQWSTEPMTRGKKLQLLGLDKVQK